MAYYTITDVAIIRPMNYVDQSWVHAEKTNFLKKHILARSVYLVLTPTSLITTAIDTIIGIGVGIAALCTVGKIKPVVAVTYKHIGQSKYLLAIPYRSFLQAINPEVKFNKDNEIPTIEQKGDGFVSAQVSESLKKVARDCYKSDNFLKRHVASRLTYALLAISCLVTRAVDGVICIPAASLAILSVGKFVSLNNLAFRTLQAPGIIDDLFYCIIKFINPWTTTS